MDDTESKRLAAEVLAAIPDPAARLAYAEHWAEMFKLVSGLELAGLAFAQAAAEMRAEKKI
jgi:hypothetical protein